MNDSDLVTRGMLNEALAETKIELRGEFRMLGVIVERLSSKIDTLSEGFGGLREQMTTEMQGLEERLGARITLLEEVIRKNSEDIRKNSEDIRKNSEDIRKNSDDIRKNSEDIRKNSEDIRKNSDDIRKSSEDIRKNSDDIVRLSAEVAQLRERFDRREDVRELQERVAAVEKKLGIG